MINPEYISELVNFYSNSLKPEWEYDPKADDMRNLQVKGAAKAFNILEGNKVALLADEVGMGKTIQSLAVCAAIWNQNPQAKILVIAPRDEVAKNWQREYETFISQHYRQNDNIVKSVIGSEPIRKMIFCTNLYSLIHEVKQGWGQLFIGKISSFSSLMAGNKAIERLRLLKISNLSKAERLSNKPDREFNNEIIRLLKRELESHSPTNNPYFDLVIIDEAHYLRNKDSDSLRVNSANIFFGDPNSQNYTPIAKKVLLLTATPNHSSSQDIQNIVSYFTNKFNQNGYKEILDRICIRRLRRLSSKALNKYNYRHEIPSESDFKNKPLSEMFFGLYQHELARDVNRNRIGAKGVSGMMKYLEGIEFLPTEEPKAIESDSDSEEHKRNTSDYKKGTDARMLISLSKKYCEIFSDSPSHPKYDKLVEDLTAKNRGEKAVVFVRRIPSVFEISRRVIEYYDRRLWSILRTGALCNLTYDKLDRKSFSRFIGHDSSPEDGEHTDDSVDQEKNLPSCKVLNLFKVIKNDSPPRTAASNFRLRFTRSKPGIFALFFSPGENYLDKGYTGLKSYRYSIGKEELENYYNSALLHRTELLSEKAVAKDILSRLLHRTPITEKYEIKAEIIPTLMTIFWEVLSNDELLTVPEKHAIRTLYSNFSIAEKEAFSAYLEKGTLLASDAGVQFFEIFRNLALVDSESATHQYLRFCEEVKVKLSALKLYKQIIESIYHFNVIYTKVFSINSEKALLDESWDSFNNAQPIYPYSADNSNQKVLRSFNTPFYPDILVATSVLQEGVNLQYFCNTVYHYGMAWTPGDNEQRIGRIDRMFGKIERLLEKDENASLNIYYPYLKDTIDEEHLGRFAKRKYREEVLIDMGKGFDQAEDYALEENEINGWSRFLRKPEFNLIKDPFPCVNADFDGISKISKKPISNRIDEYYSAIINAVEGMSEFMPEVYFLNSESNKSILIDPTLNAQRKQPVVIEILIDHIGSSFDKDIVYTISFKTPIAATSQFKLIKNNLNSNIINTFYKSGVKLCMDVTQTGGSHWGIYMSGELPLFSSELKTNFISIEEIQTLFTKLVLSADFLEHHFFQKDLTKEELNLKLDTPADRSVHKFRSAFKNTPNSGWIEENGMLIKREQLNELSSVDGEKKAVIANHQTKFIKVCKIDNQWYVEVSLPAMDPQKEEVSLLEKHLKIYLDGHSWQ